MSVLLALMTAAGLIAASFRHPFGVSPILAALVCSACFLRKRDVVLVGMGAMLVHELAVGVSLFTLVRLAAVLGVTGALWLLRVRPAWASLLTALAVVGPLYHLMLVTGDWITRFCTAEPHTAAGFAATFWSSWPYIQRSLVTETLFTAAFLGLYALGGSAIRLWRPAALPRPASVK